MDMATQAPDQSVTECDEPVSQNEANAADTQQTDYHHRSRVTGASQRS